MIEIPSKKLFGAFVENKSDISLDFPSKPNKASISSISIVLSSSIGSSKLFKESKAIKI